MRDKIRMRHIDRTAIGEMDTEGSERLNVKMFSKLFKGHKAILSHNEWTVNEPRAMECIRVVARGGGPGAPGFA